MKISLPEKSKSHEETILTIRDIILKTYKDRIAFIILFGSFARGDWVHDKYVENGIVYEFASDYDFLIVTNTNKQGTGYSAINLKYDLEKKLKLFGQPYKVHTPSIIVEPVERLNKELEKGQYFFSDIKKQGICLFDSKEFKLKEAKELSKEERRQISKDYFEQWFESGKSFLEGSKFYFQKIHSEGSRSKQVSLNNSAFILHQATESLFNCALLTLTGYKPKTHDLLELNKLCSSQSKQFLNIFPTKDESQKHCFDLLRKAYIEARYSKDYVITEEELKYLIERVEGLKKVSDTVCKKVI